MATIVVGGSNRGVGKTALVCGLIAALPEFRWTAIKITSHDHGQPKPVWEETRPGQGTDTARYLAAGAERALLLTPSPEPLVWRLRSSLQKCCHPERSLARCLRQTEAKDLHFNGLTDAMNFRDRTLDQLVSQLLQNKPQHPNLIFESNSILQYLKPDLCLAVEAAPAADPKPSFGVLLEWADALVRLADRDGVAQGPKPLFQLAALERISPQMRGWILARFSVQPAKPEHKA
jgi:hypothetical protein